MLTALALTAQLLCGLQSDDSTARVQHLGGEPTPAAPVATPPPPSEERGASLAAGPTTRRKSTSFLIAGGELFVGAATGYLALVLGIALNVSKGGLSSPVDSNDVLLLMVLPAAVTAVSSWAFGLLDGGQRTVFGSALWAVLGSAGGELLGIGGGLLLGRSLYPNDSAAAGIVMVAVGPAVAALFSMLFMELFKPGEEVAPQASLSFARDKSGALVIGPALGLRF